jgi:23S rRNA (adenine2503-C2)-methyltransferase
MSLPILATTDIPANAPVPHPISHGVDPRTFEPAAWYAWASSVGLSTDAARRWAGAVIGRGERDATLLMRDAQIPKRFLEYVSAPPALVLKQHERSTRDGFEKLLFETHDKLAIETVLIPLHKEGCVSLCISSQVGCVMGCTFCATARMPTRRNLASWEILDQVAQARAIVRTQGRRVTGAVFMGMGEPFLNFHNVIRAADWMRQPLENAISGRAITVSTVGLVQEIERFTDLNLPFRLSVSIGAATDEKRARLVPVAARTPAARIMQAIRRHALTQQERVNVAYVCVKGENVSEQDARDLAALVGDTPIRLDLIDVTDLTGRYQPPSDEELRAFRDALSCHLKQPVARRYSGGSDIAASCGSLAGSASV